MNWIKLALEAQQRVEYWRRIERMHSGSWCFWTMGKSQNQAKRYIEIARYCLEKSDKS